MRKAMFHAAAMGSFCVEEVGPRRIERLVQADLSKRLDLFRALVDFGGDLVA
jgi:hypothetical protein